MSALDSLYHISPNQMGDNLCAYQRTSLLFVSIIQTLVVKEGFANAQYDR